MKDNFVNLHLHTEYSIMDSIIQIPNLFHEIEEYGQPAVAITDHGSIAGWYDFQVIGQNSPVKPIFGCEFYCKLGLEKPSNRTRYHLIVLAKNNNGLKKIREFQKISIKHHHYKPLLPYPILFENPGDIFITTACALGSVGHAFNPTDKAHHSDSAEVFINKLFDVFGKDNVACEFQFHPTFKDENGVYVQNIINEKLFDLCEDIKPKYMIATCDSHFLNQNDRGIRRKIIAEKLKKQEDEVEESLKSNCIGNSELIQQFAKESNFPNIDAVPKMLKDTVKISNILNAEIPLNYGKVIPKFNKHKELKANFMKGRKQVMK